MGALAMGAPIIRPHFPGPEFGKYRPCRVQESVRRDFVDLSAQFPRTTDPVHDSLMLKRFFERHGDAAMVPPSGPPLTEDELKIGLLREVDLFAGLAPAQLKEVSQALPMQTCVVGGLVTSPDDGEGLRLQRRDRGLEGSDPCRRRGCRHGAAEPIPSRSSGCSTVGSVTEMATMHSSSAPAPP